MSGIDEKEPMASGLCVYPFPFPVPSSGTPHPPLALTRKDPKGSYHRSVSWQAGCLSPLQSSLTPWSPRSFCCRSSSIRLGLMLSIEAKSWQQLEVRPQLTSLQERCTWAPSHCPEDSFLWITGIWSLFLIIVALWCSQVTGNKHKDFLDLW